MKTVEYFSLIKKYLWLLLAGIAGILAVDFKVSHPVRLYVFDNYWAMAEGIKEESLSSKMVITVEKIKDII